MRKLPIWLLLFCTTLLMAQGQAERPEDRSENFHLTLNLKSHATSWPINMPDGAKGPVLYEYRMALLDGMDPVAGRRLRVFPIRVVLKDGTLLTADPESIEDSVAKLKPYLPQFDGKAFAEGVTDKAGLYSGRYTLDRSKVQGIELAVLDVEGGDGRNWNHGKVGGQMGFGFRRHGVMHTKGRATASFEQTVLAEFLTLIVTENMLRHFPGSRHGTYKTSQVERVVSLPDGSTTNKLVTQRILNEPPEVYVAWKLKDAYAKHPEKTIQVLARLVETGPVGLAQRSERSFNSLRGEGKIHQPTAKEWKAFDAVDPERKATPRQLCLAEMQNHLRQLAKKKPAHPSP